MSFANLLRVGATYLNNPTLKAYANLVVDLLHFILYSLIILTRNFVHLFLKSTPKKLAGEIILVIGGANGIGREICFQLAQQEKDLTIISWDVSEEENVETVKTLQDLGVKKAVAYTIDVSMRVQVQAAAKKIREEIGDVTILFNTAGNFGFTEERCGWKQNPSIAEKAFKDNVLSHSWTLHEFLPKMIEKGEGNIVEVCSALGWLHVPTGAAYVGSKFALRGYIECIKEDLRRFRPTSNVCISLVYPHQVETNMTRDNDVLESKKYNSLVTPSYAASRIVAGMRNNQEHIFIPRWSFIFKYASMLPADIYRAFVDIFLLPPVEQEGRKHKHPFLDLNRKITVNDILQYCKRRNSRPW